MNFFQRWIGFALAAFAAQVGAQGFPTRPVHLIVPFPPGGATDVAARILANGMSQDLGHPVIVENKAGGNATIGTDILPAMGTAAGAKGFVPPLQPSNYTFWSQETSATPSTYTLDFQVTAIPNAAPIPRDALPLFAGGLALAGAFRLRRRATA